MYKLILVLTAVAMMALIGCGTGNPNVDEAGKDALKSRELVNTIAESELQYHDLVYVPIYSDIYIDATTQKSLLAATLSIRNTSHTDSIFISKIDYFNTGGDLVRSYITNTISIEPMATVNYVIEKEDDTGGPGANFIVELSARSQNVKPLIQAVMIGQDGNTGFSFVTDGYSIK